MNPAVLIELIDILLFYVEQGAKLIRLDAIAFLWKIAGTTSIHLEQTHLVIQIMRAVIERVAPDVLIVTETNVPHEENISYFGDGTNEAHMVYQFPLPPLILHTMTTGDVTALSQWADNLAPAGEHTTFFNFIASHDGVGLRPVTGILSDDEIQTLVDTVRTHGGHVSFKNNSDGTQSPYELNISYFDAINAPQLVDASPEVAVKRFIVSQAIGLCLAGVPGVYVHSLLGSRNYSEGVKQTGRNRTINRQKLQLDTLKSELADMGSIRAQVFSAYMNLLATRRELQAFHPLATQQILSVNAAVFAVKRCYEPTDETVIALNNVTDQPVRVMIPVDHDAWLDEVASVVYLADAGQLMIELDPYQVAWLSAQA
jgi:sucrose phosphorylase